MRPYETPSDLELMDGLVRRDASAMKVFYERHCGLVMAMCVRVLRDHQSAEQLTLDIFTELWVKPERFNPNRSNPRTYLLMVCRSRAIDRLRQRRGASATKGLGGEAGKMLENRADSSAPRPVDGAPL